MMMKDEEDSGKTPKWFLLIIILSILPVLLWPWLLTNMTSGLTDDNKWMFTFLPIYAVATGYISYKVYSSRSGVAWILLMLLWISYLATVVMLR